MNLAITQLGFDPRAVVARAMAAGAVKVRRAGEPDPRRMDASARYEARQKGLTGAGVERRTIPRPELKGLQGAAYHRAYRKLMYAQLKLRRK